MSPRPASVETGLEVEAWQLWALDFEPEKLCDLPIAGCDNHAIVAMQCRTCGNAHLSCDEHERGAKAFYAGWASVVCDACDAVAPSLEDLVVFIPIAGVA